MFVFMHRKHIPVLKHIISIFLILKNIPLPSPAFPCISFLIVYSKIVQGYLAKTADCVSIGISLNLAYFAFVKLKLENRKSEEDKRNIMEFPLVKAILNEFKGAKIETLTRKITENSDNDDSSFASANTENDFIDEED